ncbi:DNA-binding transcriptional regulator GbsR (MarR family) [Fusobacterium sp. PH5-7]|uniref:replication initiator protein A n=1 Tax=Fusobacterium sp. PH5-7 TaxID=2940528 RepID=UPI002476E1F3|nr:replication initiator protein A [Fusobacterium sp. PH5-7]MDH6459690.1 DNA-binding transcriptional regulator GbsR (MarR family) [Fusobacterium sp. PH5-7]
MRSIKVNDLDSMLYYQVPKWLMDLLIEGKISIGAFKTYVLMYERTRLSARNNWIDKKGEVYIKYSYDELMEDLKCNSKTTVSNNIKDLEKVDLIDKVRCFSSSSIYYLRVRSTEDCTSTESCTDRSTEDCTSTESCTDRSTEDCTTISTDVCTDSSTELLYASKNNYNKNNYNKNNYKKKDDDTKLDKLNKIEDMPEKEKEVRPLDSSSIEFKNDLQELKDIVIKSTGINKMLIDNIMLPSKYRDINIRELINKIKESKFLLGELDTKPNINHFSVRSMIDRIMADGYMSNDSKNIKKNNVEEGWW